MVKIAVEDGTSNHTGSVCSGSVAGTLTPVNNDFVFIESNLMIVEGDTLVVPSHNNPPCVPPNILAHNYAIDGLSQSFVFIEDKKIALIGDSYGSDATEIDGVGNNSFVDIS